MRTFRKIIKTEEPSPCLEKKKVGYMILFSCNNAHQDHPNNIARQFAEKFLEPGSTLIGIDGTMMNNPWNAPYIQKANSFINQIPVDPYLREPDKKIEREIEQGLRRSGMSEVRSPDGFIQYTVNDDGKASPEILGHYKWGYGIPSGAPIDRITRWLIGGGK